MGSLTVFELDNFNQNHRRNFLNCNFKKEKKKTTKTVVCYIHSKKCWVVLTQFWVKYGQTRNVGLKM